MSIRPLQPTRHVKGAGARLSGKTLCRQDKDEDRSKPI
jgi:hypothetical protein